MGLSPLDLFSTSPTFCKNPDFRDGDVLYDETPVFAFCAYDAPHIAFRIEGKTWGVGQGNCHHWDCPRCGVLRAKQEYGRIVEGCRTLSETSSLRFLTITCKGSHLSVEDAEKHYLEWSNRFLDACRAKAKRAKNNMIYVQVTERQKRGHPHSHILTTFDPGDIQPGQKENWYRDNAGTLICEMIDCLRSAWVARQVVRSGLGEQYDISLVRTVEGASRYVAKYLFKESALTIWPKGWKRVRYSQNFPKKPESTIEAFPLLKKDDWHRLSREAVSVIVNDTDLAELIEYNTIGSDLIVRYRPPGKS